MLIQENEAAQAFWQRYLETLPADSPVHQERFLADQFGDSPELAEELLALVLAGTKTATCSCLWEWEAEGEPLPEPGIKTVVLDGAGKPACIIETTEVMVRRFDEVDAQFAHDEGEDDLSLTRWREGHSATSREFCRRSAGSLRKTFLWFVNAFA